MSKRTYYREYAIYIPFFAQPDEIITYYKPEHLQTQYGRSFAGQNCIVHSTKQKTKLKFPSTQQENFSHIGVYNSVTQRASGQMLHGALYHIARLLQICSGLVSYSLKLTCKSVPLSHPSENDLCFLLKRQVLTQSHGTFHF